jgi:FkbM family methyltransferase
MSVLFHISGTLGKLVRGRPHDRDHFVGIANAVAVVCFLVERKLGAGRSIRLRLGYGGRRHDWELERCEDLTVLEEVFLDEDYDMDIPPPSVVFDLGANFGAASVYFALRWPDVRIFAVEPSPKIHAQLLATTVGFENIRCMAYAAGATDGAMAFIVSSISVGGGFYCNEAGAEVLEVPVRSLASLMAECGVARIDLLKFDIEGAEGLLFQDPSILECVDAFVGEIHPDIITEPVTVFLAGFSQFETTRQDFTDGRFLLRGTRRPK